ncbi:hypothetical protein [Halomicrococcus sp. NG-SE-24]
MIDLLHVVNDVESGHRISAVETFEVPTRTRRGTGDTPGELSFPPS